MSDFSKPGVISMVAGTTGYAMGHTYPLSFPAGHGLWATAASG